MSVDIMPRRRAIAIWAVTLVLVGHSGWTQPEPESYVGRKAPAFRAPLLDGQGAVTLASIRGKVAIIDFWATWCAPCIESLPILNNVAASYAARGVVFHALDVAEERADVRRFLKRTGLTLPVALDEEGEISDAFGADGIPHTVIVDRNGVIRAVHSGFRPTLRQDLVKELDRILAQP
jgi:thiol-disulfide isomerase/thioredoxin